MKLNKLFHFIPFVIGLLLMTTVFAGCSDDDDDQADRLRLCAVQNL